MNVHGVSGVHWWWALCCNEWEKPTLANWTAGMRWRSSWVWTSGVATLPLTANMTLLARWENSVSASEEVIEKVQTVSVSQTHQTVADVTGILSRPPLGSVFILDTRMDTACKHVHIRCQKTLWIKPFSRFQSQPNQDSMGNTWVFWTRSSSVNQKVRMTA